MKCFGEYENDRICGLCEIVNKDTFKKCKNTYNNKIRLSNNLSNIKEKCPYAKEDWDEYDKVTRCTVNGDYIHSDFCKPGTLCKKYLRNGD